MENKITVYINDLDISERTKNSLARLKIFTLNELVKNKKMDFSSVRNIGKNTDDEIQALIELADDIFLYFTDKEKATEEKIKQFCGIPIEALGFDKRARNVLNGAKIETVADLLRMKKQDIAELKNAGNKTINEITDVIENIIKYGNSYIEKRKRVSNGYINDLKTEDKIKAKGFDFETIDILCEKFSFKYTQLIDWFGISRQRIYEIMNKRNIKRSDIWTGKEMTESEKKVLLSMIESKKFSYSDEAKKCLLMNNMKDDLVCIFVYENEIKCFFLKDMPDDLKEKLVNSKMNKLTEKEFSEEIEGRIVNILKKPYFIPKYPDKFRINAQARGMSLNDYSIFISGYKITDSRNITDDKIIEFFEENMIDGKVYISSDQKNQWIRILASRNGYGIKEFIEFYGYESKLDGTELSSDAARERHINELKQYLVEGNTVYLPADSKAYNLLNTYSSQKGISINEYIKSLGFNRTFDRPKNEEVLFEEDMKIFNYNDDNFEEKIFTKYPLIGSKILKPDSLEKLNRLTRLYINESLSNRTYKITLKAKMQITIALINYAKNWKTEENSDFWKYISLQFGFRDSVAVKRILQNALKDSMKANKRLFIEDSKGNAFKSTAVIHAFSTKKSWMAVLDFLFDFYKYNLNWKYVPNDSLFDLMINSLKNKLESKSESTAKDEDSEIVISSNVYMFQEGVRKLILLRPLYTKKLFERLVEKIDALINFKSMPVKCYEDELCEEWFREKINHIINENKADKQKTNIVRDVVLDYSNIRIKYILKNEVKVMLSVPDIRLNNSNIDKVVITVFNNENEVFKKNLNWYGNELGKTIQGTLIDLPDLDSNSENINISVKITCNGEEIYDSQDKLYRKALAFSGSNEVMPQSINKGDYTFIMPIKTEYSFDNAEVTEIDDLENLGLKGYFVELDEGYLISINNKVISFNCNDNSKIFVMQPSESAELPLVEIDNDEYRFAYKDSFCRIVLRNCSFIKKYIVLINGRQINLDSMPKTETKDGVVFSYSLSQEKNNYCKLKVIDIDNEKPVFDMNFIIVSSAKCSFNREFYFLPRDYEYASLYIKIDDYEEKIPFSQEDDEIIVPYKAGKIHVTVPKIVLEESSGSWLNGFEEKVYIDDVPQNSIIKVKSPEGVDIKFFINNSDIMYDGKGVVTIGNTVKSFGHTEGSDKYEVKMCAYKKETTSDYNLAEIYYNEIFTESVKFWSEGNKIFWNHGGMFIGQKDRIFNLELKNDEGETFTFKINEDTEHIDIPSDMKPDNYIFSISVEYKNFFCNVSKVISNGNCSIGDINILRFKEKRIAIEYVTEDIGGMKADNFKQIKIKPCWIDKIVFKGMENTSEGYCPVYEGVMYIEGFDGKRYEFSFTNHTNSRGYNKQKLNPVRIVYLNDTTLSITDSEKDGLYYYYYFYDYYDSHNQLSIKRIYTITDEECTNGNKNAYSLADLYIYKTEECKNV